MSEQTERRPAPETRRGRIIEECDARPQAIAVKKELDHYTLTANEALQLQSLANHHLFRASEEFRGMINASEQHGISLEQTICNDPDRWTFIRDEIARGCLFKFCESEVQKFPFASSLSLTKKTWAKSSDTAMTEMIAASSPTGANEALFDGGRSLSRCKHDDMEAEQSCLECMALSLWSIGQSSTKS